MPSKPPAYFSRRELLGWSLLVPLVAAGCSSDRTSPPPPPAPTGEPAPEPSPEREPVADEDALLQAWLVAQVRADQARQAVAAGARADAPAAATDGPGDLAQLEAISAAVAAQAATLGDLLIAAGVTLPEAPRAPEVATVTAAPPPATSGPDTDQQTATAGPESARAAALVAALAHGCAQDAAPEQLALVAALTPSNAPMMTALTAARAGWARTLGQDAGLPAMEELTGPTGASAADVLSAAHRSVYLLEVLSARSEPESRPAYEVPLLRMRGVVSAVTDLAGGSAEPAPIGFRLPDLDSTQARAEAVTRSLEALIVAALAQAAAGDADSLVGVVTIVAEVIDLGQRWQVGLVPFPGMALPPP